KRGLDRAAGRLGRRRAGGVGVRALRLSERRAEPPRCSAGCGAARARPQGRRGDGGSVMAELWSNPDFQLVFWSFVKIMIILNGMLGVVSYLIYAERKIAGHMQARTGPNRVGPLGLLQPIADVMKLFFKEEFVPEGANKVIFYIAPMLAVLPALVTFSVVPFGPTEAFRVTDINVGLLLFLALSSLGVYSITLAGWSSNNKYALLGGLRSAAQMISYELAMGLSTIGVLLLAGSLSMVDIVAAQAGVYRIGPIAIPHW